MRGRALPLQVVKGRPVQGSKVSQMLATAAGKPTGDNHCQMEMNDVLNCMKRSAYDDKTCAQFISRLVQCVALDSGKASKVKDNTNFKLNSLDRPR